MLFNSRVVFKSALPLTIFLILALSFSFVSASGSRTAKYEMTVASGDHLTGQSDPHHADLLPCGPCGKHKSSVAGHLRSFKMTTNLPKKVKVVTSFFSGSNCTGALRPTYTGVSQNVGTVPSGIRKAASHKVCFTPTYVGGPIEIP
ncbi:hypothetical protein BJ138DRAFT_488539 [Hygrophoropsis aurantiaca]|uniref:Uncharacterized protein n=1 Tax=Hygrophoropsis aurantiaca TaxID=72124 RepID=A0ACB8A3A7_9AGAM|nr:hypothetical protein BJ138DRAFT_488539 [Hygrophoropsis aurantiaca]